MSQMFRRACSLVLPLEDLGLAAEACDTLLGLGGEAVRVHGQGLGELTVAQDLEPIAQLLDDALLDQELRGHDRAGLEDLEAAEVDRRELLLERVIAEAALRHAPV